MAAAAALVIGLAAAAIGQALQARPASTAAATAPRWTDTDTGASAATGARATVRYAAQPWGTELEARQAARFVITAGSQTLVSVPAS
jgi:hypothetical protein